METDLSVKFSQELREQALLKKRTIFISEAITSDSARKFVSDLLILDSFAKETIYIYIKVQFFIYDIDISKITHRFKEYFYGLYAFNNPDAMASGMHTNCWANAQDETAIEADGADPGIGQENMTLKMESWFLG